MVFSGVRAGSLNFSGGILSFFGGILGNLTVSQILTGSPCVSSSGWEDEERVWPRREHVVAMVDGDPLEAVSPNQIRDD